MVQETVVEVLDDGEKATNEVSRGKLELEEMIKAKDAEIKAKDGEIKKLKLQAKQAIAVLDQ